MFRIWAFCLFLGSNSPHLFFLSPYIQKNNYLNVNLFRIPSSKHTNQPTLQEEIMKKLFVAAAIMASLVCIQGIAEARGGGGAGGGGGMSSGSMTRMSYGNMGMRGTAGTQHQTRLRERSQLQDQSAAGIPADSKLQTRQQLRDPSLHTDVATPDVISED